MTNIVTDFTPGITRVPQPIAYDGALFALTFDYALPTGQAYATNDTIELGELPIGVQPVDCFIANDALCASAGTISLGILNSGKTDLDTAAANGGAVWLGATPIAVSAAAFTRATTTACAKTVASRAAGRSIAVKVNAGFTTPTAGARLIVTVLCRMAT